MSLKTQLDSNEVDPIRKHTKIKSSREILLRYLLLRGGNQVKVSNTDFLPHSHSPLSLSKRKARQNEKQNENDVQKESLNDKSSRLFFLW
jgi:hypothetical protein